MGNKPLISIITVCYNSEKTIKDTIESVLNQTYTNIEYILVDGASEDCTVDVIKSYEVKFRKKGISYKWVSDPDRGIYDAMNKGIDMANGELVGIINSDDWYEIDAVEIMTNEYKKNMKIDVFHGLVRIIKDNGKKFIKGENLEFGRGEHPAVFITKKAYEKFGKYSLNYKIASDQDLLMKIKFEGGKAKFIERVISNFRWGGVSNTYKYRADYENTLLEYKYNIINYRQKFVKKLWIKVKYFNKVIYFKFLR